MKLYKSLIVLTFILGSWQVISANPESRNGQTEQSISKKESSVSRINTEQNKDEVITADSQIKASDADNELARKLRERIVKDDELSINAQNIKIITVKDAITLKGPVANKAEKVKIENIARSMAGKKKVYNRLTY